MLKMKFQILKQAIVLNELEIQVNIWTVKWENEISPFVTASSRAFHEQVRCKLAPIGLIPFSHFTAHFCT